MITPAFTSFTMSVATSEPTWLEIVWVTTSSWVATSFFVGSSGWPVAVSYASSTPVRAPVPDTLKGQMAMTSALRTPADDSAEASISAVT